RGLADRSAGVRANRRRAEIRGNGRRTSARASARRALEIPRVEALLVCAVLVRRAHRELIAVRLAEHDRARVLQLRDDGRVVRRRVSLEDLRRSRRLDALRDEDVFY